MPDSDVEEAMKGYGKPSDPDVAAAMSGYGTSSDPDVAAAMKGYSPAFDPKTYDPKVKEGEYPVTGPVDWLAQKFEHVTPGAEYVGTALDTLRRPVASLIAGDRRIEGGGGVGDRLKLAYHSGPALLGGNPDLAPTPEETKHALGVKDLPDKPGFITEGPDAGKINWGNVLSTKVPNEAGNVVTGILTDPSSYFTFGAGRAAQAAKAAKTEALALKMTGLVDKATSVLKDAKLPPMPLFDASTDAGRAAMESYLKPSIQQTIAGGDAALKIHPPHLPLIPKIPVELQLRIPKFLAPIGRVLEPLGREVSSIPGLKWTRAFANPDPSAPHEIVARLSDAEAKMRTSGMMKEVNVSEEILKKGSGGADGIENAPGGIDKALNYASDLTEQFSKTGERLFGEGPPLQFSDEGNGPVGRFRTGDDAQIAKAHALGLDPQTAPNEMPRIDNLDSINPGMNLKAKVEKAFGEGPRSNFAQAAPKINEALDYMSGLQPRQRATVLAYINHWVDAPARLLKMQQDFGIGVSDINLEKMTRPSVLIGAMEEMARRKNLSTQWGESNGTVKPMAWDKQVGHEVDRSFKTSEANPDAVSPPPGTGERIAGEQRAARVKSELSNPIYTMKELSEKFSDMSAADLEAALRDLSVTGDIQFTNGMIERKFHPDTYKSPFSKWPIDREAPPDVFNAGQRQFSGSKTKNTPKLSQLLREIEQRYKSDASAIKNGKPTRGTSGIDIGALMEELKAPWPKNQMTPREIYQLNTLLGRELPQSVKEFNAVPNYRPGTFSNDTRLGKPRQNPNMGGTASANSDVTMKRESENGPASGARDIPNVRKTVLQMNIDRERGSYSSEGVPLSNREEGWFGKYVVPEGYKDAQRALRETAPGATTFEGRIDQAFAKQIAGPIYQSLRQDAFEAMAKRIWNAQPDDAINAVKNEARNGVYVSPGIQRPATLADVQKKFTAKGGIGDVRDLLNPQAIRDLDAGTLSIEKAFNREWSPYNRAPKDIKGVTHWMHGDTVRVLDETQKLGTDPYKLGRFLGFAAPMVTWMNDAWRKNATYRGPQFLAYTIRNDIGDMSRMRMGEMLDATTVADKIRLLGTDSTGKLSANGGRMAEFFKTGDTMKLQGMTFNAGPMGMIDGPTLAKLYQKVGLSGTGELAGDVLGNYMPKNTSGVDNSWAGQLSRKSSTVKAVVDAAEKAGDWAKTINAAREEANRFAGFVTRLRNGDTPNVAAVRVTEALFDFRRLSPAAHALRATGIVPFASWHSKVYPYVLKYAVEHPGEFIATLRVLQAFQQKEIDESQIPEWMQGKHNMIVRKFKNPVNGHNELGIQTASGVLPMMDMMELASDPSGKVGEMLGPLVKTFWDIGRMNLASEENKHSAGENAWQLGEDIVGRPASSARQLSKIGKLDPRTGETRTATDWAMNQVLPMHSNQIDMTTTGQVSVGVAKKNLTSSLISVASAKMELGKAQAYLQKQRGDLNTVSLMTKDQYALKEYVDRVQTAQAKMLRMQRAFTQAQQAQARNQKVFEGMSRAP